MVSQNYPNIQLKRKLAAIIVDIIMKEIHQSSLVIKMNIFTATVTSLSVIAHLFASSQPR